MYSNNIIPIYGRDYSRLDFQEKMDSGNQFEISNLRR